MINVQTTAAFVDSEHAASSSEASKLSGTTAAGQRWWKSLLSEDHTQEQEPPLPIDEPLCYLDSSHASWCNEVGWPSLALSLPCWLLLKDVACAIAERYAPNPSDKEVYSQGNIFGAKLFFNDFFNSFWPTGRSVCVAFTLLFFRYLPIQYQ